MNSEYPVVINGLIHRLCHGCMENYYEEDKYHSCRKCCRHNRIDEKQIGTELICTNCGEVMATGMPTKKRTLAERDADEAQTRWEIDRRI